MQAIQHSVRGVNGLAFALMFGRQQNGSLYLPQPQQSFQAVAADVDQDGDEDKYAVRYSPITKLAGVTLTASGGVGEIEFEPQKWTQVLEFHFLKSEVAGILVTNFTVGQDPQFPSKAGYAMPLGLWSEEFTNKLIDAPFCGPNVPLTLELKNTNSADKTIWGGIRGRVIVG